MPQLQTIQIPVDEEARAAARAAGLVYVNDAKPGISRRATRKGFRYVASNGAPIKDPAELARLRALAVPPAYRDVWICPDPRGHLQATGRDARGRKQYRYHARWRAIRDSAKFESMLEFGRALPSLRRHVDAHLAERALGRDHILATIVWLLDRTLIRVGNEEYARENRSYGLTTLRNKHVRVAGGAVRFAFRGKSGIEHAVTVEDRRVARAIHQCMELPGQELFQYVDDDGQRHVVDSADVNDYLHRYLGPDFTAKDYRTWAGSVLALEALQPLTSTSATDAKRQLVATIKDVATQLRNTPTVCKKCYVHPQIISAYEEGALLALEPARPARYLTRAEATFLRFLERTRVRRRTKRALTTQP